MFSRFILLDLCHPMNTDTVKLVIESLDKALILSLSFPVKEIQIGISVLNSDFKVVQSRSESRENYNEINKALKDLLKMAKEDTKVTVQKYKELISQSLDKIFQEFLPKLGGPESSKQLERVSIQIAIVTKKTASVLVEILTDVLKKLQETNSIGVVKKFKIVQVLNNNEEVYKIQQKNEVIECTTCLSHRHYLTCFFKDWLLNPEGYLEILLNDDLNFSLKCDDSFTEYGPNVKFFESERSLKHRCIEMFLDKLTPKSLEIIRKIPINGLCPSLVFGTPRRITATLNKTLDWAEFQVNRQVFKGLCLELQNTAQGLLTRSRIESDGQEIFTFQFITSDGDILLMNDVAPEELYLPKKGKSLKSGNIDEGVTSFVKVCLENIKLLDEYCPRDFTSGIHQYLTYYLIEANQNKIPTRSLNCRRKLLPRSNKNNQNVRQNKEEEIGQVVKKPKFNLDTKLKESKNVHPALLPKDVMAKYRKINSKVFNMPELSQDFSKDLQQLY